MVLQKNCSFFLNEGDVLKLGKMIVSIKEIVLHKDPEEYTMMETKIVDNNFMTELAEVRSTCSRISKKTGAPSCRVCFDSHDSEDDPLISPCNCSGTLR